MNTPEELHCTAFPYVMKTENLNIYVLCITRGLLKCFLL